MAEPVGKGLEGTWAMVRVIGLEEHCWTPEIREALTRLPEEQQDDSLTLFQSREVTSRLEDLGDERLRQMDLIGVDMAVLSVTTPATQILPAAEAVPLARQANDRIAAAIAAHPDRFSGFATLPMPDPAKAAEELRRSCGELGLKGAMIHGRTGERYLDHEDFRLVLAVAAELNVPIYLHPQIAPRPVRALHFDGFGPELSTGFATGGWGWHVEAGINALRLILAGVFDAFPNLQVVLGHWGETVMLFLDRADSLSRWTPHLKRDVAGYFRSNFYVTGSGIYTTAYLSRAVELMGIDRVMYSTDYPFQYHGDGLARRFIDEAPLAVEEKEKVAWRNAARLLRL